MNKTNKTNKILLPVAVIGMAVFSLLFASCAIIDTISLPPSLSDSDNVTSDSDNVTNDSDYYYY